jgi:hypothetical protein
MTAATFHADSPEIRRFVAAYEENQNIAGHSCQIIAEDRRKYIAIDEERAGSRSGRFLIDRTTGIVYTIKGYGQRGYSVGTVTGLTAQYRDATATYDPRSRMHTETGGSRVARSVRHVAGELA